MTNATRLAPSLPERHLSGQPYLHASYLHCILNENLQRSRALADAAATLRAAPDILSRTDTFVVTGVSGLIMGTLLAHECAKDLTVVRKQFERRNCHSSHLVEGRLTGYGLFVDDFISTGRTLRRALRLAKRQAPELHITHLFLWWDDTILALDADYWFLRSKHAR